MIMYQTVFPPMKKPPENASTLDLLRYGRYVDRLASGFYAYLPLGKMITNQIELDIRKTARGYNFLEVSTPVLQDRELWEKSGRLRRYGNSIYNFSQDKKDYVISPTAEELMVEIGNNDQDMQPLSFFQIGERVRNEPRPAFGLVRAKSFILADFYAVCHSEVQAKYEFQRISMLINSTLKRIGVEFHSAFYTKKYAVSYWQQSDSEKQCTVYVCNKHHSWRDKELLQCPNCGQEVDLVQAIELADTAVQKNGDTFLATAGIGVSRLLHVLAKNYKTATGFCWPEHLAPYQIEIVSCLDRRTESIEFYYKLKKIVPRVLLDLRNQSLGRKFIDADLFGAPVRLVFGKQTANGRIEVWDFETQEKMDFSTEEVLEWIETKSFLRR